MDNKRFINSMKSAASELILRTTARTKKACFKVETDAVRNCPRNDGYLAAGIFSRVELKGSVIIGTIGCTAHYAPYVHQGTGIYAKDGNGRKTPWTYMVKTGRYRGFRRTAGQKPNPFLENAKVSNMHIIPKILAGRL